MEFVYPRRSGLLEAGGKDSEAASSGLGKFVGSLPVGRPIMGKSAEFSRVTYVYNEKALLLDTVNYYS
jgi:hypothetical protein